MAITRSQIARQLLAEGGAPNPRKPFANGGFDYESAAAFGSDVDDFGMDRVDSDEATPGGDVNFTPQGPSIIDRIGTGIDNTRDALTRRGINRNMMTTRDAIFSLSPFGAKESNLFDLYREMEDDSKGVFAEGFTGTRLNPERAKQTFDSLKKEGVDVTKDIGPQLDNLTQAQISNIFNMNRNRNTGGDNNPIRGIPLIAKLPTDIEPEKSDMAEYIASVRGDRPNPFEVPEAYRLADGGEVRQEYGLGSIVKKVTGAVKKVAKSPIGKAAIAVGLAGAPFGGGSFFGSGSLYGKAIPFAKDFLGKEMFKDFFIKDGSLTGKGLATLGIGGASLLAGAMTPKEEEESISQRIADRTGLDIEGIRKEVQDAYASGNTGSLRNKYPFLITQSAAAAEGGRIGFAEGTKTDEIIEEGGLPKLKNMPEFKGDEVKPADMMMASNMQNDAILENLFEKYLDMGLSPEDAAIKAREEFDRMSKAKEPDRMMANEGGLMNLGGNEMDLRGGGFVPLGVAEKADDVPARLSKNEFVFTADAVRAAGGGSVDRGADLMYKTMKQLENKVA